MGNYFENLCQNHLLSWPTKINKTEKKPYENGRNSQNKMTKKPMIV